MTNIPFDRINWVDVLTVILLVRMGYIGMRLGLGAELVKLAGTVAGIFVSFRYYQGLGDSLAAKTFLSIEWAAALVLIFLVMAGYFVATWLLRLFENLAKLTFEKKIDQVTGFLAGIGRGLLAASVLWVACMQLPSARLQESIQKHSVSGETVSRIAPAVYDTLDRFSHRLTG